MSLRFFVDRGLNYDGPGPTSSLITPAGHTQMCWARATTNSTYGVLIRIGAAYYGRKALGVSNNGEIWCHQSGADQQTGYFLNSPDASNFSRWTHIALSAFPTGGVTTSTVRMFANGQFLKEFTGLEPIDRAAEISIGSWGGSFNSPSYMAGVKIFAHAMSGAEIRREMLSLRPVGIEPWMYMPYDDGDIQAKGWSRSIRTGYSVSVVGGGVSPENSSDNPALPRFYPKRRIFLAATSAAATPRRLMMMGVG